MGLNKKIEYKEREIVYVLKEIELMLMSLKAQGDYYQDKDILEYQKETTRFIDEWLVTARLARIRYILSKDFDDTLGEDDMDDLERVMKDLVTWKKPNDMPNDLHHYK